MNSVPLVLATEPALVVYLVGLALSIGLAVASAALAKRNKTDPNQPIPTTVLQGGYVPRVIGRRRIAPLVAAVGHRRVSSQRSGSGKNKGPRILTYYEDAVHMLCVGPAYAIHRIWVDGAEATAWAGSINRTTTPSGSFVPFGATGGFYVYWGDEEQDPNSVFSSLCEEADPSSGGVDSGFPFFCYLVWQTITLGPQPIWPQIEYEVEVRPQPLTLVDQVREVAYTPYLFSDPDYSVPTDGVVTLSKEATFEVAEAGIYEGTVELPPESPSPSVEPSVGFGSNHCRIYVTEPQVPYETYSGDITSVVVKLIGPSAQEIELLNETALGEVKWFDNQVLPTGWQAVNVNPLSGQYYSFCKELDVASVDFDEAGTWTLRVEITSDFTGPPPGDHGEPNHLAVVGVLDLVPQGAAGPPADSWIESGDRIGANPADTFYELLVQPFPHGIGVDPTDLDLSSLAAWHDLAIVEDAELPCNVYAARGEEAGNILGQIASDHGMFLSWNPNPDCGHFVFQPVRSGLDPIAIPAEANVGTKPEVETPLLFQPFDKINFTYPDKERDYKQTVVGVGDDAQSQLLEVQRTEESPIYTATDYDTARQLAEVKSQEDLPGNVGYKLDLNRDSWRLWPGLTIDVSAIDTDLEGGLILMEVHDEQLTAKSELVAVANNYDVAVSAYAGSSPPSSPGGGSEPPVADVVARLFEIPNVLLQTRQTRVCTPRVRGSESVLGANVYLSSDGTTYEINQQVSELYVGFTLVDAIALGDPYEIDSGPVATLQGTDQDELEDLSTLPAEWRRGRQALLIGSELFFVQRVVPYNSAGTQFRLMGLIRARLGTRKGAHAIGAQAYMFPLADVADIGDSRISPGVTLYAKPAPYGAGGELSLDDVTARTMTVRGNGLVPEPVTCLRVTAPTKLVNVYRTGDDVSLAWSWSDFSVPGTGAGMQGYGAASGQAPVYGTFEVRVYDAMDVLVRTEDVGTTPSWTYDNADLQADLGGETDFRVEVRNINGGFRSEAVELEVTFE